MTLDLIDPISLPASIEADVVDHFLPILRANPTATIGAHERKGTAILRLLAEHPDCPESLWDRVHNTEEVVRRARTIKGPIILIDDLLRTGTSVQQVVERLIDEEKIAPGRITVAVLGSHANYEDEPLRTRGVALRVWRRRLAQDAYSLYRTALVATFQGRPRHYLDTEHIEVNLAFEGARSKRPTAQTLAAALSRSAEVAIVASGGNATRISAHYPVTAQAPTRLPQAWPDGSEGMARKSRLIERGPSGYSLLPIFLPDAPSGSERPELDLLPLLDRLTSDLYDPRHDVAGLFDGPAPEPRQRFLRVGLLASLEPLSWAVRDLKRDFGDVIAVSVPRDRLDHLRVTFPSLDLDRLIALVTAVVEHAPKRPAARSTPRLDKVVPLTVDDLHPGVASLLQSISRITDQQAFDEVVGLRSAEDELGVEHSELLTIGGRLGYPPVLTSALLDHIIDRALFSTKVALLDDGRIVRLYRPDGEVTSRALRHDRRTGASRNN